MKVKKVVLAFITQEEEEKILEMFGEREADLVRVEGVLKCIVESGKIKFILITSYGEKIGLIGTAQSGLSVHLNGKLVVVRGRYIPDIKIIPEDALPTSVLCDAYLLVGSISLMSDKEIRETRSLSLPDSSRK